MDLIDFTPYAERSDPELVRAMQTRFYTTARRVVAQHGGVVEKYIGDAVMALFGAPVATETDALRCVRAGLELQRVLSSVDGAGTSTHGLQFRIGVATGEALVDIAAARNGGQAIVAGDVVNTASRLQSVAPPGGVLVCGRTHGLTADTIRYAERPPVTLRGRSSPTEVWLALAPAKQRGAVPDAIPQVDREHELSLLVNALHRGIHERTPQLVTIFGQAGIGKSRLTRELHRHAQQLGDAHVTWYTGQCPPFGENVTYAGLADIVKADAGILDTDSAETARARLAAAARRAAGAEDGDRLAAALGPLVGLPGGELPAKEAESAWRRFLVGIATRGPTVLLFEDLHWADEPMRRFIELLAAAAKDVPLLLLTTARPELVDRDPSWAGVIAGSLTITLPPLRSSDTAVLYAQLFRQLTFTPELLQPLVELADGNPLYAQEYVRMLIERDSRPGLGGRPGTASELPTPDSVHAVIANRVDLLDPADRTVLQAAAVVGMQFWPGAVAAALGYPGDSVERSLRRLEQREFLDEQLESSVAGESEFRFRHVLVRDVCYQRLPRTERVARHARAADWLERLASHRDTDLAEVLAHHRWTAHEIARTVGIPAATHAPAARQALQLAARRAYALHALETAAGYAERALSLFDPDEPAEAAERYAVELLATEIAFYRDQQGFLAADGAERLLALANELAKLGADRDSARAWTLLGQAAWLRLDRAAALDYLSRAVALFDQLPDSTEKVDAYGELARLHMLSYEREPAIAAASTAADIARRLDLVEALANARVTMAITRYEFGDPDALAELAEVTELCRTRRLLALRRATQNLANIWLEEGDWQRCIALITEGQSSVQGGHNLATGHSTEAIRAYAAGELDALAAATGAGADEPGNRWDMRQHVMRSLLRLLRDEPAEPAGAPSGGATGEPSGGTPGDAPDDVAGALATARSGGFERPLWAALGSAALCRALQGRPREAAELVTELTESWQRVPVMASGAWASFAAYAAAIAAPVAGPEAAGALRAALAAGTRRNHWAEAALHTATAATLAGDSPLEAGREHLAAAEIYQSISSVTDQMLALALATAAFTQAGEPGLAEPALAQVREFAQRAGAPGLLRLAETGAGGLS